MKNDKIRIVWLGPKGACFEEHKDAAYAERRAKSLREFLLSPEWRDSVELIYPAGKDKAQSTGGLFE